MKNKNSYILGFHEIDRTKQSVAGGKGANLGELCRIKGIHVPEGFCVTTEAYKAITGNNPELNCLLDALTCLKAGERPAISEICSKIRGIIESAPIIEGLSEAVAARLAQLGENDAWAVRSSATAEDLPTASFAGQQDTYLNVVGKEAVMRHIRQCWASLYSDRAVIYRLQHGFDHHGLHLAVVVQKMIFPQAAGTMFTADPVTSNRKVLSIDASFGLGEALVAGLVNADVYKVSDGKISGKKISAKKVAVYAAKDGGTKQQAIAPEQQARQAITDEQILRLERMGRTIEAHFGCPQDIEWCLANDAIYVVQSRPITTLYPIPGAKDQENRVYLSVGHQQMMTDAMKPLGLSLWQLRAARPMFKAGGRLFVDVTEGLARPADRENLLEAMGQHDPLIKDALLSIVERGDFIKPLPNDEKGKVFVKSNKDLAPADILAQAGNEPAVVTGLIRDNEVSVEALKQSIQKTAGPDLFDFIMEDIRQSRKMVFDAQHMGVIIAAMNASSWLNEKMNEWLGEKNVADILTQSVSNNITSEMGLALLEVADTIRPHGAIIEYLQQTKTNDFLDRMVTLEGGQEARNAIEAYLGKYGVRCAGEIDITKTRWREKPAILIPVILGNIKNFGPGAGRRKFERGLREALEKEQALLERLKQLPGGEQKAQDTKAMIDLVRSFAGYREYPKYGIVSRFFVYKQALLKEIGKLVQANVLTDGEDAYYLTFEELREAVCTHRMDEQLIRQRKEEHKLYETLTPPRVITSDGEIISGAYKRENIPAGAIAGLAVSSGVVEGRARVVFNMEEASLEEGDILVTRFTDPSWTPLFVSIKGLVTEVGGLMTHGAVVAREYGLPAVVGVEQATTLIKDGQRIRVNGTEGWVEIL